MQTSRKKESLLIGIRLRGNLRSDIKNYMQKIRNDFSDKKRYPHITLFGPFGTHMARRHIVNTLVIMAKKYPKARFSTDGFSSIDRSGWFSEGRGVVTVKIIPNEDLKLMRYDIAQELLPHSQASKYDQDKKDKFIFHATLAIGRTGKTFKKTNKELKSHEFEHKDMEPELVLYSNHTPVFAYLVGHDVTPTRPSNLYADPEIIQPNYNTQISPTDESGRRGKIFLVSDMHFDHKNIIKYTDRPFKTVEDMNRTLVHNWNSSVGKRDRVYYLGDMTFGRGRRSIDFWLSKLNGEIRFMRGNHDTDVITKAEVIRKNRHLIKYGDWEFLLTHDPDRPPDWDGWIIHGDKHSNHPVTYPHINKRKKTVNVCAEYTEYAPMNLDEIIAKISE